MTKKVDFLTYLHKHLKDEFILKFWFKIPIPGDISNHLMGHTIYFHNLGQSYFIYNGGFVNENFIFS